MFVHFCLSRNEAEIRLVPNQTKIRDYNQIKFN